MKVHVVIPAIRRSPELLAAIASVSQADSVVVVDDGFGFECTDIPDRVVLVRRERNGGYAAACNSGVAAIACSDDDAVLFLNDDAHMPGGWLPDVRSAARGADVAVLGFRVEGPGLRVERAHSRTRVLERFDLSLSGCAYVVRVGTLRRVGGLDERFFMYGEETDLFLRVQRAGYHVVRLEHVVVWHHGEGSTSGLVGARVSWWCIRNTVLVVVLNLPWRLAFRHLAALGYLVLVPRRVPTDAHQRRMVAPRYMVRVAMFGWACVRGVAVIASGQRRRRASLERSASNA